MDDDFLITTNYFQSLDIKGGAGAGRAAILRDFLSRTRKETRPRQARRALAKVCFRGSSLGMVTNQSVVFEPAELSAQVALGKLPATSGRYYEVRIRNQNESEWSDSRICLSTNSPGGAQIHPNSHVKTSSGGGSNKPSFPLCCHGRSSPCCNLH